MNELTEITSAILKPLIQPPEWAIVLGSGVNIFNTIEVVDKHSFENVFGVKPTVSGHTGSLTIGYLKNHSSRKLIAVLQGRYHLYEGHKIDIVTLPLKVLTALGIKNLILTNAAGGINSKFNVADLMVITSFYDCLTPENNEHGLIGILKKPSETYTSNLLHKTLDLTKTHKELQQGCYAAVLGPSYETTAEVNMFKAIGADAVGMSTVPELKFALACNVNTVAISVITNVWGASTEMGGHKEVLEVSAKASKKLEAILTKLILG